MKKIIFLLFLMFSVVGFSRFIEECEITSKGVYNNGVGYVNCVSLSSGRHFNFRGVSQNYRRNLYTGNVYKIYFEGQGYSNLYMTGYEYLY